MIERARGQRPDRRRGQPLPRRRLLAVVQRPRPPPSADRRGDPRPARPRRPLDDARAHPPGAAELAARLVELAPPGLDARLLLRLGLDRGRDRAEDGVPVLAPARRRALPRGPRSSASPTATTATRSARSRSAGSTSSTAPSARCCSRPTASTPATQRQLERVLDLHGDEIAAVIVEPLVQGAAGILVAAARLPAPGARALRRARRAADRRRGRDRLRPHRDDVRLRAGARRARLPLPRQGPHRRLPAARGDADDRARLRGLPRRAPRSTAPSSTATPSPATRSPARRRSPASRSSSASTRCFACSRRSALLGELLGEVAAMPEVAEVRGRGFMVGIDLGEHDPALRLGHRVTLEARERGAIVRPLGDTVVLMPPLAISKADLRRLVEIVATRSSPPGVRIRRGRTDRAAPGGVATARHPAGSLNGL